MFPREDITDDWEEWKGQRLPWALEKHLLPLADYDKHTPPQFLQDMLDENEADEQPMPIGLGYHKQTGYFVVGSAGQGPFICGIEKWGPPKRTRPEPEEGMIEF